MNELLFIYNGNTVFYAKDENGHPLYLLDYLADIGVHFINFIENDSKTTPYSHIPGYENSESLKEYFGGLLSGLICEGIKFFDLNGNIEKTPMAIELLKHDDRFKEPFMVKHLIIHKLDGSYEIRTAYSISNLYDALYLELIKLIESGKLIKRCEHCNRVFFPKDRSEKYCDRPAEGNKICKDVGYLYKVENDEFLKTYNTAYKTKHAEKQRKTRGKSRVTIETYENALKRWRTIARVNLEEAQNGNLTLDEFKKILNRTLEEV